jgi:hypothetical protein
MNTPENKTAPENNTEKSKQTGDDSVLEKIARAIDPPSREISDEELIDPGKNIPDSPAIGNKENKPKPPDAK